MVMKARWEKGSFSSLSHQQCVACSFFSCHKARPVGSSAKSDCWFIPERSSRTTELYWFMVYPRMRDTIFIVKSSAIISHRLTIHSWAWQFAHFSSSSFTHTHTQTFIYIPKYPRETQSYSGKQCYLTARRFLVQFCSQLYVVCLCFPCGSLGFLQVLCLPPPVQRPWV